MKTEVKMSSSAFNRGYVLDHFLAKDTDFLTVGHITPIKTTTCHFYTWLEIWHFSKSMCSTEKPFEP